MPIVWLSWLNASAEMIAPALPDAAEIPCAVARNLVGKTSAGYAYVVAFAPKLKKNWRKEKQTMKDTVLSLWKFPARTPTARVGS